LGTFSKRIVILLHIYTDFPGGSTDAVASRELCSDYLSG